MAIKVGLEAQIAGGPLGLSFATAPVTIFPQNPNKPIQLADPGCRQV